jgi:hypothetical protein
MHKFPFIAVWVFILQGLVAVGHADEPANRGDLKTYTVSCKLVRKLLFTSPKDKLELETLARKLPDLTTLEGTRGEYHSGGKAGSTPYGFHLQVKVTGEAKDKVRLELKAEDTSAEGGGFNPVTQTHRQCVVRQVRLGKPIKLELDRNEKGEGVWVELTVQEAPEE